MDGHRQKRRSPLSECVLEGGKEETKTLRLSALNIFMGHSFFPSSTITRCECRALNMINYIWNSKLNLYSSFMQDAENH